MIGDNDIKKIIKNTLRESTEDKKIIEESLVAQEKVFTLKTELLSAATKESHLELYDRYVKDFNSTSAKLDGVDKNAANSSHSAFRSLKLDETYNMNAVYLHELYFASISDLNSQISMDTLAYMKLSRDFGTFDAWQRDFIACCMSSRCGWAMTYFNFFTQTYMNAFIDLHSLNVPVFGYPIAVMDMWQHAYYRDYLDDSKAYVVGMMKQLNWNVIESRVEKTERIHKAIRG